MTDILDRALEMYRDGRLSHRQAKMLFTRDRDWFEATLAENEGALD